MSYLENLATLYAAHAVADDKAPMQAYMKNRFAFFGIKSPLRKSLTRIHIEKYGKVPYADMHKTIKSAYAYPQREMHYFAMGLLETHKKSLQEKDIQLVQWMITHNSWWDSVDYIATYGAGELVMRYAALQKTMDTWSTHSNMWLRRTAILHQLKYKQKTDENRLFRYCLININDSDFFIQKAMGWALRQYAYIAPKQVLHFVTNNDLPKLSIREACKHLSK